MGLEGVGSSVVIALAALLWLVYLVPTWFRRREYLSTERNAVRLQQTLRIMAETAEVPEPIHVESNARAVAAHQRLLRQEFERARAVERAREASMSRAAAQTLATLKPEVAAVVVTHSPAALRLRRSRATTSAVLLVAVAALIAGFVPLFAPFAGLLVASGALVGAASIALLARMAKVAEQRARLARDLGSRPSVRRPVTILDDAPRAEPVAATEWTPVPLPKPLYLSTPAPQAAVSETAIAAARARLLAEAEAAEVAEAARTARIAEAARNVTPIERAPSRFASMGIVDDTTTTAPDLDEVLRRRRAV